MSRRPRKGGTGTCKVCGAVFDRTRRDATGKLVGTIDTKNCEKHRWFRGATDVLIDKTSRYQDDVACQIFVSTFQGGATLDAIAEALGVSRERIRQIEAEAIAKLRASGVDGFVPPRRHDESDEGPDEEATEGGGAEAAGGGAAGCDGLGDPDLET